MKRGLKSQQNVLFERRHDMGPFTGSFEVKRRRLAKDDSLRIIIHFVKVDGKEFNFCA